MSEDNGERKRLIGPPVPGETDAERDERERNNRAECIRGIAIGDPPYDDEDDS